MMMSDGLGWCENDMPFWSLCRIQVFAYAPVSVASNTPERGSPSSDIKIERELNNDTSLSKHDDNNN
jgi:hypothetical protein